MRGCRNYSAVFEVIVTFLVRAAKTQGWLRKAGCATTPHGSLRLAKTYKLEPEAVTAAGAAKDRESFGGLQRAARHESRGKVGVPVLITARMVRPTSSISEFVNLGRAA